MSTFFGLLMVVSVIFLIVGLTRPIKNKKDGTPIPKKSIARTYGIAAIVFLILSLATKTSGQSSNQASKQQTPAQASTQAAAQPSKPLSDEGQITQIIQNDLKGNNNNSLPYYVNSTTTKQSDDSFIVEVEFNADENLTNSFTKGGIEDHMTQLYKDLYNSGKNISLVIITADLPVMDKFGNNSQGMVYRTELDQPTAKMVNWNADSATLELQILPGVWDTLWISPWLNQ